MNDIPKEYRIPELDKLAKEIEELLSQLENNPPQPSQSKIKFGGGENAEGYSVSTTPFNPITPKKDIPSSTNESTSESSIESETNEIIKKESESSSSGQECNDCDNDNENNNSESSDENNYTINKE